MGERTRPSRGEVWRVEDDVADLVLVVSSDDWNRRRVASVLAVPIEYGFSETVSAYATVIEVDGERATIYAEEIVGVRREAFTELMFELDDDVQDDVDDALNRTLTAVTRATPGRRPAGHPYPGQIRFADLHIEGEGDKPVVVVSSEAYGAALEYQLVIVCRKTSNPGNVHDYDVVLRSQTGKVVCSDVRTVLSTDLRERTTGAAALSATEQRDVLRKVRRVLGLADR